MNTEGRTVIEINGVKLEVDLRTAKRIDQLQVGDRVRVLVKKYSDSFEIHNGTIVGFEPFNELPTIIVAYIQMEYNKAEVKFLYYNAKSKDVEIVKALDNDQLDLNKATILQLFDREINSKKKEIEDIELRKQYFETEFRKYWEPISKDMSA